MQLDRETWGEFGRELQSRSARLCAELHGVWKDLSALAGVQRESFSALGGPEVSPERPQSIDAFFASAGPALLANPFAAYGQRRPLQRSLAAMEEYESVLGDLLRRLPKTVEFSGRDLVQLTGVDRFSPMGLWRPLDRRSRTIPLRDVITDHLQRAVLRRSALDGAFQQLLAESSLHLLASWQAYRRAFLAALTRSEAERVDLHAARKWWTEQTARHEQRASLLLARYDAWARSVFAELSAAFLAKPRPASDGRRAGRTEAHKKHLSFWSRQQRAVRSVIDLELHLAELARETAKVTVKSVESLNAEHAELIDELDGAIAWLRQWPVQDSDAFPQPKARLLSSEERVSEWLRRASARIREELPVSVEALEPRRALPGWRKPWRNLEPERIFLSALAQHGAPVLLNGFKEAEAVHRAMVREIERAREVVSFGLETARAESRGGEAFSREAVSNALTLLTYHKGATPDIRSGVDASAAQAEAVLLLESDLALEKSRIGLLAHITRQRGGRAFRQLEILLGQAVRTGSRYVWAGTRTAHRWALLKIGWIAAPERRAEPVVRRVDLAETLEVHLHARDLPMIYRRLFRLAPVEDPRFLVGRDVEMAGFADALRRWEEGKGASVIVIGARGSGKTSLINCAASGVFAHCDVVRGQFCERLQTPAQMTAFVRRLLHLSEDTDVAAALGGTRRVILIEEFERTFLRAANGFEALRALLDLMYSTGRSTLWVFSVNEAAYRYLDAVVGLGRHFSHRINAMSVVQEHLTGAILQRHGLSGLRLEFAPLPEEDPRVSGLRRFLGFEQDRRKLFLDALYEESEGIFRSAFELWQGCIERVEGGIVHMRQPLTPDYERIAAGMTLEDCFMLKAILQHGSLTAEEMAQVLAMSARDGLRQLERLQLLDILEPEPACPGLRVRPEAGRLVREALSRRNLT